MLKIWKFHGWALLLGCVLDWIFADPYNFPHPVRLMGKMIEKLEKWLRKSMGENLKAAGVCLVLFMCLFWILVPALLLRLLWIFPPLLFLVEAFICYQLLAARGLEKESMKVCRALKEGDVEKARRAVSMIVGRDTAVLDEAGITRAAVETVAENTSDGITAPFLFMALFGPVGGFLCKAVNTMDSMVGYKNDKYLLFGRGAAKFDDVVNFLPARLTGCLMTAAAWLLPGFDGKNAWKVFLRDRKNHASPNSAHGEAACAGALHLRLAGDAWYFGVLHKKPYIGDDDRPVEPEDIRRTCKLMFGTEFLMMEGLLLLLLCL